MRKQCIKIIFIIEIDEKNEVDAEITKLSLCDKIPNLLLKLLTAPPHEFKNSCSFAHVITEAYFFLKSFLFGGNNAAEGEMGASFLGVGITPIAEAGLSNADIENASCSSFMFSLCSCENVGVFAPGIAGP